MKYVSAWLSRLSFEKVLLSTVLATVLFFASGFPAFAAKSAPTKGTVQLDKIEQKTQEAIDSPPMSLEAVVERSKGKLNEVQGNADSEKMKRSDNAELPVVKQAEKALKKMKSE